MKGTGLGGRRFSRTAAAVSLLLVVAGVPSAQPAAANPAVVTLADGTDVRLSFKSELDLTDWRRTAETGDGGGTWESGDFRLTTTVRRRRDVFLVGFRLNRIDALPFELQGYGASVSLPFRDDDAVWSYNRLARTNIMHSEIGTPVGSETAANVGIPFEVLVDKRGTNRLALGLLSQRHRASIEGRPSADRALYTLSIEQLDGWRSSEFSDTFFVSRWHGSWYAVAQSYTASVDRERGYKPLQIPEAAFDPTFDSWYWTLDRIDERLVWDLAQRSQALGFKNYLLDAGWDAEPGEYFLWLDGSTGNYTPPPRTFPNLRGLLDRMRGQLGLRPMLWMQQYALGRRSFYYPELAGTLSYSYTESGDPEETATLCPRVIRAGDHLKSLFSRIIDDYRPDAFWFDWQEDIPGVCAAAHEHEYETFGDGYRATQQAVTDLVLASNPQAFIDMRWPYANLYNKPYTHLWQPIDSPDDFEVMRLRAMNMRPFSAGVLMGTDEMYWDPQVTDAKAARYMAAVVFTGVPYFGPNLLAEPKSRGEMLRAWLRFYQDHRLDLTRGNFIPYGDRDRPDQWIETARAAFIYYGNRYSGPVALGRGSETIYIVNASGSPGIDLQLEGVKAGTYRIKISDLYLQNTGGAFEMDLGERVGLELAVPVGCMLTLTRIS
jgi:hypothetical protein